MATKRIRHETNPFETLGTDLGHALKKGVAVEGGKDFLRQLLGVKLDASENPSGHAPKATDGIKNGELVFSSDAHKPTQQEQIKRPVKTEVRDPHIDYRSEVTKTERFSKQEVREMEREIQLILDEIQKLLHSSRELQGKFKDVAMEQVPTETGRYHKSRLEALRISLQKARKQAEASAASLTPKGKGKYKVDHSKTNVNLSNERNVATQTG